jgi:hypothetical protein
MEEDNEQKRILELIKTLEMKEDNKRKRILELIKALESVKKCTSERGFGKRKGGTGTMPCPMQNCSGIVRFVVYPSNGHISAECSRNGCLNFRE